MKVENLQVYVLDWLIIKGIDWRTFGLHELSCTVEAMRTNCQIITKLETIVNARTRRLQQVFYPS